MSRRRMDTQQIGWPGNTEEMSAFFDQRVEGYEEHMAEHIEDFDAFYASVADQLPIAWQAPHILDLGIGTGLELDPILERFPNARVTGIDLSREMLEHLADKPRPWIGQLRLLCRSFLDAPLGESVYDAVVSVMALHHWIPDVKLGLYRRIHAALKPGSLFINADYVETEDESSRRLAAFSAEGAGDRHLRHIDLPLTVETELELMHDAGFTSERVAFQRARCATLVGATSETSTLK